MGALVHAHVDPLDRFASRGEERIRELLRLADEREDGAIVIGVRVDVQQACPGAAERVCNGVDGLPSPPLADVRDRLEQSGRIIRPAAATR
jgi:hypothetical protein